MEFNKFKKAIQDHFAKLSETADHQFIRFNCAHMAWLWQNGNLLQVYC